MQNTTGVAVLATHLAVADRRALSQAWYSALHLAERTPPARAGIARAGRVAAREADARGSRAPRGAAPRNDPGRGVAGTSPHAAVRARHDDAALGAERRAPKTVLARRIERALTRCATSGTPCSFAVNVADGRVRLLVRSDASGTRVVAVCAGALRERVERALAQARFALAERGVRAEVA